MRARAGTGEITPEVVVQTTEGSFTPVNGALMIPIERIAPNPDNPRQIMADGPLSELAASISERGLLQPLLVRRDPEHPGNYLVIAGSRRLLAARRVHADDNDAVRVRAAALPCIIRESDAHDSYADALLENLARTDLTRAERMEAILRLHNEFGWSANYISKRTGRNQHDISELLRVAKEPRLAALVRHEALAPSVAGAITTLPTALREKVIAEAEAGLPLTTQSVKQRAALARVESAARLTPSRMVPGEFANPAAAGTAPAVAAGPAAEVAVGPRTPSEFTTQESDVAGAATNETPSRGAVTAARKSIAERLGEIEALLATVDESDEGQAVLITVRHHIDEAYGELAHYVAGRQDAPG
jgi:ParB family chromosome partitioning protein